MDHAQFRPIKGKPFLVSSHILSCLKIFTLKSSFGANADLDCQRRQKIARLHPSKYINNPQLLHDCKQLASETFTFINNWNYPKKDPNTYGLFDRGNLLKKLLAYT